MSAQQPDEQSRIPADGGRAPHRRGALADVPLDRRVRVLDVSALPDGPARAIARVWLVPGACCGSHRHAPVTVVQIEHTELAIETEVARAVRVMRLYCKPCSR